MKEHLHQRNRPSSTGEEVLEGTSTSANRPSSTSAFRASTPVQVNKKRKLNSSLLSNLLEEDSESTLTKEWLQSEIDKNKSQTEKKKSQTELNELLKVKVALEIAQLRVFQS